MIRHSHAIDDLAALTRNLLHESVSDDGSITMPRILDDWKCEIESSTIQNRYILSRANGSNGTNLTEAPISKPSTGMVAAIMVSVAFAWLAGCIACVCSRETKREKQHSQKVEARVMKGFDPETEIGKGLVSLQA